MDAKPFRSIVCCILILCFAETSHPNLVISVTMFFTLLFLALVALGVYYLLFNDPSPSDEEESASRAPLTPSEVPLIPSDVPKTSAKSARDKVAKSFESAEWLNTIDALSWP